MTEILLDRPLRWDEIDAIARRDAVLALSAEAGARLAGAHAIVRAIVDRDIRAYGVNTGIGALSDVTVKRERQLALSRNILMSHAVGVGAPLGEVATRAIMAASVNNLCLGYSGVRPALVERMVLLLNAGCTPEVPGQGSVGYLSHMAHIGLLLIGHGHAWLGGVRMTAAAALARLGISPLVLEAKEGLSLVNGTPCGAGLSCLALARGQRLLAWADAVAAMSFETQRCQISGLNPIAMALRPAPGLLEVAARLNEYLAGSAILAAAAGARTQDALSLRSIPHVHGAARDVWAAAGVVVTREMASVTDNPVVAGSIAAPLVFSQAHAVGAALGLAMDQLAVAVAQLGMIAERRIDRMLNPLVSGLPAFLARESGVTSGFMIAQYTTVSLVSENRRLAAPASLDGGVTSGLQEDILCHATPAALKALAILRNVQVIIGIELLAACQSYDLLAAAPAPGLRGIYGWVRRRIPAYEDDRPLGEDIAVVTEMLSETMPERIAA